MCSAARWKPRRDPNRPGRPAVSVARRIPGVGRAPDDRSGPQRAPWAVEKGDHSERQLPGRHPRRATRRTAGPPHRCHVRVTVHTGPARPGSAWRRGDDDAPWPAAGHGPGNARAAVARTPKLCGRTDFVRAGPPCQKQLRPAARKHLDRGLGTGKRFCMAAPAGHTVVDAPSQRFRRPSRA